MPSIIRLRRSNTATSSPASLEDGEVAINQADRILYYRDDAGVVRAHDLNPPIFVPISGRFYLQNNEYNGLSPLAPYAQNASLDQGNANAAFDPTQNSSGFSFPYDMVVERLYGWIRNSGTGAPAWSFIVFKQLKVDDATTRTNTVLHQDPDDFRNYADNVPHFIDEPINQTLAAGEMLSISARCATNNNTEYVYPLSLGFVLKRDFS